jgi:DNA-binding MarR family transcriptional regulator
MSDLSSLKRDRRTPRRSPTEQAPASPALQDGGNAILAMTKLSRELKNATSALEKVAHEASGTNDLTLLHWAVLANLACKSSCKQVDLKSTTGIAAAYLTRLVDELAHRGLVRRHRSSGDRRQMVLALTEAGKEAKRRLLMGLGEHINDGQLEAMMALSASLEQFVGVMAKHDSSLEPTDM